MTPEEREPFDGIPTTEAQDRRLILLYVTGSGQGTWLFAPNQNEGNNN